MIIAALHSFATLRREIRDQRSEIRFRVVLISDL